MEFLENRPLLPVAISVSGRTVAFTGGFIQSYDNPYLRTNAGVLQYSTDGTSYSSDLGAGQTLSLDADTTIDVHLGGPLSLQGLTTLGKAALTIDANNPLNGDGNLDIASVVLTSPVEV